jgi:hypothetical protein
MVKISKDNSGVTFKVEIIDDITNEVLMFGDGYETKKEIYDYYSRLGKVLTESVVRFEDE